ncbi:outer membrane lipoprotein chaperone LolA [Solimicrobium silvestre]|uniref:Outer-membrane lipoprotein carrier protein n=1 Tax=Solimicrobium silvestre TaxID=2099400 RepID=A0A2S9GT05_9BURK|nr:outer membrane lipoprotein chaperone LolA [Solimicrobium silvestre]PRC90849.1 lolA: outer membrane lipoprotein carrier protein LolA [Solimicrobium silvestre]
MTTVITTVLKKFSISIAMSSVLLAGAAQAGGLDQFKAFVSSTHSAKGDFIQRQIKVVKGEVKLSNQSSGTFMFARPGKFIWLYQKPYDQLLQADGEKLYMYDKDLNQVTVKLLGTALSSSPAAILFGSNDLEKNFTLKDVGQKDGMDWLQATPKDKDSTFALISIGMQDGVPREMDLRDTFNQTTVILLQNLEKNPVLKPDQFKFTAPAGADVFNSDVKH